MCSDLRARRMFVLLLKTSLGKCKCPTIEAGNIRQHCNVCNGRRSVHVNSCALETRCICLYCRAQLLLLETLGMNWAPNKWQLYQGIVQKNVARHSQKVKTEATLLHWAVITLIKTKIYMNPTLLIIKHCWALRKKCPGSDLFPCC